MDEQSVTQESDQIAPENGASVDVLSTPADHHTESLPPPILSKRTVIIIMGVTGSGKSTFVNQASKSDLKIGNDLESCTSGIQTSQVLSLEDEQVVLIDTPGFDDTNMSDTEVLELIARFLGDLHSDGVKLAGIIYVHRISDDKFGGLAAKNFRMFRELCGEEAMKNVILMTNMWGRVTPEKGAAREQQLKAKYFKEAIGKGAKMYRHENTPESAQEILRKILHNEPVVLKIQREMVDEGKEIGQTGAGAELNRDISQLVGTHEEEIKGLEEGMRKVMKEKDEESRREFEEEMRKSRQEIAKLQEEWKNSMRKTMADLRKSPNSIHIPWRTGLGMFASAVGYLLLGAA